MMVSAILKMFLFSLFWQWCAAENKAWFKQIAAVIWILLSWQIMKNEFEKWTAIVKDHIWVQPEYMKTRQDFGVFHLPQCSCVPSEK